jgi:succinyl-diaminopimelate desuccinylase
MNALTVDKGMLVNWVDLDRDKITDFLRGFLRARSPNPPGDTREAADYVTRFLDSEGIPYRVVGPDPEKPNIVSTISAGEDGRRLILNGHIDVFPVGDGAGWSHDPWGGELVDGKVYGRGACDMKTGTTASIMTFAYLNRVRNNLRGSVTLTVVSDEESGGRLGAGWLVNHVPEALGDCVLNGEPSSPHTLRFGEKGILWLRVVVSTPGGHGAYTHLSPNPVKIAAKMIGEFEALIDMPVPYPEDVASVINDGRDAAELSLGKGGAATMSRVTVNIGTIRGGLKVNMIPRECEFEVDLRLPPGVDRVLVMREVDKIASRHPEAVITETRYDGPLWSPPYGEMAENIIRNSRTLGIDPKPLVSLGGSDLKFWRERGVPSYYYGPTNRGMGTVDEYVEVDQLIHVTKVHLMSAIDYLQQ